MNEPLAIDDRGPQRWRAVVFVKASISETRYHRVALEPQPFSRSPVREECFALESGGDWYVVERVVHQAYAGATCDAEVWGRRIGRGDGDTDRDA